MNLIAQSTTAWTSLLVFKTVEGPRFLKGVTFAACNSFLLIFWTFAIVGPLARREEKKYEFEGESIEDIVESDELASSKDSKEVSKVMVSVNSQKLA